MLTHIVGQMNLDGPVKKEPTDSNRFGPAPPVDAEPLKTVYEEDPLKVLKYWPEEHPKFKGQPGDDAVTWLSRLAVHLNDRSAHPAIWHKVGGLCLGGKASDDYCDAALAGTRPKNWDEFKHWLVRLSPLGTSPAALARELGALKQGPNETLQAFYARYRAWMSCAKLHGYPFDAITSFVNCLTKGLAKRVFEEITRCQVQRTPLDLDQVVVTAMEYDSAYRGDAALASTSTASSGSGSGKRRTEGGGDKAGKKKLYCYNCRSKDHLLADCKEPKTERQAAYEAAHPPTDKGKKKA
ncbi:hypothetical protein PTTG_30774 [Puccinia triticina 1-1 BBBD Race 1]|uniref:CCHC-type domain-containing protein n=1 Tax=Puccinia triticina (isolate 1-1 / race 1 (BBBD)) TaxID=630390 RepID=A0A180FXV2_PUCT1|nr:hypothetical protein PTTG_30774 [Puccinia triticina 1-1 BBBD Race 1]